MRLIALVDHPDHVCCRYRLAAFASALEASGHTLELRALPRRWWSRWSLFRSLRKCTVILQRALLPAWQLALLRRSADRLVFDFDDAVFLRDSYARKGLDHPVRLRRFRNTVRACDAVVAGNGFLRDQAARFAPADRVHVIPTCVDPAKYRPAESGLTPLSALVRLTWIGSSSTLQGLERIAPLLERVGQQVPGLELKLICDRPLALEHLPVVLAPWSEATEASDLATSDVGISWVPDDQWSRGKCGLKVLQYMAAGLPVVANPVGVHGEMVEPGHTGFLAQTPAEWVHAVSVLAADPALRRRLGLAGRRRLEERYATAEGARRWLEVLAGLGSREAQQAWTGPSKLPSKLG